MDYKEQLSRPLSKCFLDELVACVLENPLDFKIIYQLIFDADKKIAWRAAWACVKISERKPEWFDSNKFNEISTFAISTSHGGLQRSCLSILSHLPLPSPLSVEFINACFDWMISAKSPIAVQALSMRMLCRICKSEPDFKQEFLATLENIDIESYSPGFKSTKNNVVKILKNN